MIDLTDGELEALYDVAYDEAYYGDDDVVYTDKGDNLRSAVRKLNDEAVKRKLW